MSEENEDILEDIAVIDESLDLSDLDQVGDVIDDLDKSLSDINFDVDLKGNEETISGQEETGEINTNDETGEINVADISLVDSELSGASESSDEELLDDVNAALDDLDNIEQIDDFDPLALSDDEEADSLELPDFKSVDDISKALTVFEDYSIAMLEISLEKIEPSLFKENGDYVRAKRKISSLIKKKEQEIQDEAQAEIDRIARENEQANNILPIDKLIKSASGEEDQIQTKPKPEITKKSSLSKINIAPVIAAAKKSTEGLQGNFDQQALKNTKERVAKTIEDSKEVLANHFNNVLKTKTFATGFLIFFEVLKTTIPAIVVGLFVLNLNKKSVSPDILESLVSNDPARVQIGLELVKSNISNENDRQKYYELAYKKLSGEVDHAWNPEESNSIIKKATFILGLNELEFSDGDFDMRKKIDEKITLNKKTIRSTYEAFYNTEMEKLEKNSKFIGSLREANIFLKNNKCLNSLEKFIEAERFSSLSKSVRYGKTISVNCLSKGDNRSIVTQKIFDLQGKVDANIFLNELKREPASK